jgi:hypothetical protein
MDNDRIFVIVVVTGGVITIALTTWVIFSI